jgi:hypothetical protein
MKEAEYLAGIEAATTVDELEAAIQAPFKHPFRGAKWNRISDARIKKGLELAAAHSLGRFVPRFSGGRSRTLTVCGETYKVGRGQNGAGVRYTWHYAGEWAMEVLRRNGFTKRAAHRLWDGGWATYPHRSLKVVEEALAGRITDPVLNVLIRHERTDHGRPVNYTVERAKANGEAMRPCPCGGTLFDWGAGHTEGFDYVNWHCNVCPDVFTEYLGPGGLYALRNAAKVAA